MSTPVIAFACKHCERKLKVKAALAGKQAKCPGCGKPIVVPTPKTPATKATAAAAAQPKQQEVKDEFGLGNLDTSDVDPFAGLDAAPLSAQHNPLANHVVSDPGFASGSVHHEVKDEPETPKDDFGRNPILMKMEEEQQKYMQQQATLNSLKADTVASSPLKSPPILLAVIFGMSMFFGLILGLTMGPGLGVLICFVLLIASGPVAFGIQIWGVLLVMKYRTDDKVMQVLLFVLVPIYNIIYSIKHWSEMKGYFGSLCVISVCAPLSFVFTIVIAAVELARNS